MFKSLKNRIGISAVGILAVVVTIMIVLVNRSIRSTIATLEDERIHSMAQAAEAYFHSLERNNALAAQAVAASDNLAGFVGQWNSGVNQDGARQHLLTYLNNRKAHFTSTGFTVVDRDGIVMLRTHWLDHYNDPASATMMVALGGDEAIAFSQSSAPPIGLVNATPIWFDGEIIGAIASIVHIADDVFISSFAQAFNADIAVFANDQIVGSNIVSAQGTAVGSLAPDYVAQAILTDNVPLIGATYLLGREYNAYYFPLHNLFGVPVGIFFVGFSVEETRANQQFLTNLMLIVGIGGGVIAAILLYGLVGRLLRPLERLATSAQEIAKGNTAVNVEVSDDEIGRVAGAFKEVLTTFHVFEENFVNAREAHRRGEVLHRMYDDRLQGEFDEVLRRTNGIMDEYVMYFEALTEPFIVLSPEGQVVYLNKQTESYIDHPNPIGQSIDSVLGNEIINSPAGQAMYRTGTPQTEPALTLQSKGTNVHFQYSLVPFIEKGELLCIMMTMVNTSDVVNMQARLKKQNIYRNNRTKQLTNTLVDAFGNGNLSVSIQAEAYDDDTRDIAQKQQAVEDVVLEATGTIKGYVDEITQVLQTIAVKNLDVSINQQFQGDFGTIQSSIDEITSSLSRLVQEIRAVSEVVETGAEQISQSTAELGDSFEVQYQTVLAAREAMNTLTEKTQQNADEALAAKSLSEEVKVVADQGSRQMADMTDVMEAIKVSSTEIANVANIIEDIAFQTNLLALNAAVEAARAGDHGRGFAVVAEEVRSLAGRSANAARETTTMIANSITRVNDGVAKSAETAEALKKIVEVTAGVTDVISHIADLSGEQASEITKIKDSMDQIYQSVSDNVQQTQGNAAVSEQLTAQTHVLNELVSQFKIKHR